MDYSGKYFAPSVGKPVRLGSILMRVAAVLVCLVLVSVHLMSGMYAKYSTTGSSSDEARVAKLDVDVEGEVNGLSIDATTGADGNYVVTVKNNSEVTVRYDIIVTLKQKVPGVVVKLGDETLTTEDYESFTISDVGELAPNAAQVSHTLTFALDSWDSVTASMEGEEDTVDLGFSVTVRVVQVD